MKPSEQTVWKKWKRIPASTEVPKMVPVASAKRALTELVGQDLSVEYAIGDLLANVRHLCAHLGIDYYECDDRARHYFLEEINDTDRNS